MSRALRSSLYRPVVVWGVEIGVLFSQVVAVCAWITLGGWHLLALATGLGYGAASYVAAAWTTKRDPLLPVLYLRSLRHPDYLPARPRLGAGCRRPPVSVPWR